LDSEHSVLANIWTCDDQIRVTSILYGEGLEDPERYIGRTDYDWLELEDANLVMDIKRRALTERRPLRQHITLNWRGAPRVFDHIVIPNLDSSGKPLGLTCLSFEIVPPAAASAREGDCVRVDASLHSLLGPASEVRLSRTEWRLLDELLSAQGAVVSREQLLEKVWGPGYEDESSLLHDAVSRLRHRFSTAGLLNDAIETVRGIGYRLRRSAD
jgi:hypothetical protein